MLDYSIPEPQIVVHWELVDLSALVEAQWNGNTPGTVLHRTIESVTAPAIALL